MKIQSLFTLLVVCAFAFLTIYPADAVIYGKRGDDEATIPWVEGIKHWELGPNSEVAVVGDKLELKAMGDSGLFFNHPDVDVAAMGDYELEVSARKIGDDSKYFHLFLRTVEAAKISILSRSAITPTPSQCMNLTMGQARRLPPAVTLDAPNALIQRIQRAASTTSSTFQPKEISSSTRLMADCRSSCKTISGKQVLRDSADVVVK